MDSYANERKERRRRGRTSTGAKPKKERRLGEAVRYGQDSAIFRRCQFLYNLHFLYTIGKGSIYHGTSTAIFEDNQGAVKIAENPINHPKTKHIANLFYFVLKSPCLYLFHILFVDNLFNLELFMVIYHDAWYLGVVKVFSPWN